MSSEFSYEDVGSPDIDDWEFVNVRLALDPGGGLLEHLARLAADASMVGLEGPSRRPGSLEADALDGAAFRLGFRIIFLPRLPRQPQIVQAIGGALGVPLPFFDFLQPRLEHTQRLGLVLDLGLLVLAGDHQPAR